MKTQKLWLLWLVVLSSLLITGCWQSAEEGTVQVQTIDGQGITKVIPSGGFEYTWNVWYDTYYPVNLRDTTEEINVSASTKDNAAFVQNVAVTWAVPNAENRIMEFVRKFGLDEKERADRRFKIFTGLVSTEVRDVMNRYNAYDLLENQESIRKEIEERLKPKFNEQLVLELRSVQLQSRPDFVDDRIEQAASAVVANQKLKEAEEAALAAARVNAEKKQVEAQTYANPALFKIRQLELQVEIARELRQHSGTLVIGGQSPLTTMPIQ